MVIFDGSTGGGKIRRFGAYPHWATNFACWAVCARRQNAQRMVLSEPRPVGCAFGVALGACPQSGHLEETEAGWVQACAVAAMPVEVADRAERVVAGAAVSLGWVGVTASHHAGCHDSSPFGLHHGAIMVTP